MGGSRCVAVPLSCSGCCAPRTVPASRGRVADGQGLILPWFKHMGAWVHLQNLPADHCQISESAEPDSAATEGPSSLPASSRTPKRMPEYTAPPFPELPRNNWGPLSLQGHRLQLLPSSSISLRGQIQPSSSCMAPAAPGQPGLSPASLAPASRPECRGDREGPKEAGGKEGAGCMRQPDPRAAKEEHRGGGPGWTGEGGG